MLKSIRDRDNGERYLDHVQILTGAEYKEFLGFDGQYEKMYDKYDQYSFNIFHTNSMWQEILKESIRAKIDLKRYSNQWISTYL